MSNSSGTSFGNGNYGFQVGQSSGSIRADFHLPPERPETPPKPTSTVPFCRDANFVKREDLLQRIRQACSKPASRAALVGLGGVGKSQLAIEYAYRVKDSASMQKQDIWLFWVHASTKARVQESFKSIADVLKLSARHQPGADILRLVERWLSNEHNGKWFMVLDSADDLNVFYNARNSGQTDSFEDEKRPLYTYLPQSANGSILITTRNSELALRLTGTHQSVIEVGPMDPSDALTLLATRCEDGRDLDAGLELVKELSFIPLAISQAGAYIQERWPRISVAKYLDEFRKTDGNKSSLLDFDASDLRRDRSASNSIITTCQITFDHIRFERRSAVDLLSLMSFFDCRGIPDDLLRPVWLDGPGSEGYTYSEYRTDSENADPHYDLGPEFENDVRTLRNYSLIKTNETGNTFEMHALVQRSMRKWLVAHGETELFEQSFLSRMVKKFPRGRKFENWETCQRLFAHVEIALNNWDRVISLYKLINTPYTYTY
ncbi:P-loop containing nucleoside triphosphate hydrolase protein [Hypoxylon sp. FL1857]|nr:P-loop containing nucleoside triphosphate hydrolase protein [Hypoxylon sp. FL1857]